MRTAAPRPGPAAAEDVATVDYAGARLTPRQIAALARAAGCRDVDKAVAVALAESSGRVRAVGDQHLTSATWGPSIGLWQIRSLREQTGTGGLRDERANLDPATNARHACQLAATRRGWKHWSTVLHGSYRRYLPAARAIRG